MHSCPYHVIYTLCNLFVSDAIECACDYIVFGGWMVDCMGRSWSYPLPVERYMYDVIEQWGITCSGVCYFGIDDVGAGINYL